MRTNSIKLLDCTLRDGAYIVEGNFENSAGGIIKRLQEARIDLIEVGWLKDAAYSSGSTYYHIPNDLKLLLKTDKERDTEYLAMIDYDRYNLDNLPLNDGQSIDAIRVVFPHGKMEEGCQLIDTIRKKGYKVYIQVANTLSYSDYDLLVLTDIINRTKPECLSIVDTFGAMFPDDLERIFAILNNNLDPDISLGFHSHNNMQMSYALSMQFAKKMFSNCERNLVVDSSLCGMGRGAGNTPTELMVNYLNRFFGADYDINIILDIIDTYMASFQRKYKWGYSIPYLIAGMFECHVNNVAYLTSTHAINSKDMKSVFSSMKAEDRRKYNYDLLEEKYREYTDSKIDDEKAVELLREKIKGKNVLVVLPGKSSDSEKDTLIKYAKENESVIVGVNSVLSGYKYDYLFFTNKKKYQYYIENNGEVFKECELILTSNVKNVDNIDEHIVNYNDLIKYGWMFYDNAFLMLLRLMKRIEPQTVAVSGFDGYKSDEQYSEFVLQNNLTVEEMYQLHDDIFDMMRDFDINEQHSYEIIFLTNSPFEECVKNWGGKSND